MKDLSIPHEIIVIKATLITGRKSPAVDVNEIDNEQQPEIGNTTEILDDVVFIFQESLPEKGEIITRSSVLKDFNLITSHDIIPGFDVS